MIRAVVLGAGRRVQEDVIPSLLACGLRQNEILIVRKKPSNLSQFPKIICINSLQDFDKTRLSRVTILISCLPSDIQGIYISQLSERFDFKTILVDTPVEGIFRVLNQELLDKIRVIEDAGIVFNLFQFSISRPNIILNYKGFFDYHGVAILNSLTKPKLKVIIRRIPKLNLRIYLAKKCICISIGQRNYKKSFLFMADIVRFRRVNLADLQTSELRLDELHYLASKLNIDMKSLFEKFPKNALEVKRLGLAFGLRQLFNQSIIIFPKMEEALMNEKLAKGLFE
jgi:hypothetical protein